MVRNPLETITGLLCAICISAPAFGGAMSVEIDKYKDTVIIDANRSSIDDVLNQISDAYGFNVTRDGRGEPYMVSGKYEGPMQNVLLDILTHENHMIVFSSETGEISRIVLYGASKGTAIPTRQERLAYSAAQPVASTHAAIPQPVPAHQLSKHSAAQPSQSSRTNGGRRVRGGNVN